MHFYRSLTIILHHKYALHKTKNGSTPSYYKQNVNGEYTHKSISFLFCALHSWRSSSSSISSNKVTSWKIMRRIITFFYRLSEILMSENLNLILIIYLKLTSELVIGKISDNHYANKTLHPKEQEISLMPLLHRREMTSYIIYVLQRNKTLTYFLLEESLYLRRGAKIVFPKHLHLKNQNKSVNKHYFKSWETTESTVLNGRQYIQQ